MGNRITVVVAECFGAGVRRKAELGPVWVVRSAENQRAVNALRRARRHGRDHVILFTPPGGTAEAAALAALDILDPHDAAWVECEVVGARPTAALARAFTVFGAGTVEATRAGFVYLRAAQAARPP